VVINEKRYPLIGTICMDQLMIEVDKTISIGDQVELIGKEISVDEVAQKNNTINYEVVCMFTSRVPIIHV
jgi:alanine racemase